MSGGERVQLFAKYPRAGLAKTRLIPALGADHAARWQAIAIGVALERLRSFAVEPRREFEVWYTGADEAEMRSLLGSEAPCRPQADGDLGQRLVLAMRTAFDDGIARLCIIGTDAPGLSAGLLDQAMSALESHDVVLGPALDGGYYLIAMKQPEPRLFTDIAWSSECVLEQTLARAHSGGLTTKLLPHLSDVDHPEDLIHCRGVHPDWEELLGEQVPGRISVIVPTLNEANSIEAPLDSTRFRGGSGDTEVIVADGGSSDSTCELASAWGARVVRARAGRARQLNAGAALATGEWLLFLHADSRLPEGYGAAIETAAGQGVAGGAFRLAIDSRRWDLRGIACGANLRSRWWGRPYGDQGLFIRREHFFALRGFRDWPLMEDYEFVGRMRRVGRTVLLPLSVTTSPRRWLKRGSLRSTLLNQWIVAAYHAGVSPERLAALYRGVRR